MNNIMKLSELNKNEKGQILSFSDKPEVRKRLHSMGLAVGTVVEVLMGSKGSNYLVSAGNTRIGIETLLAEHIIIKKL